MKEEWPIDIDALLQPLLEADPPSFEDAGGRIAQRIQRQWEDEDAVIPLDRARRLQVPAWTTETRAAATTAGPLQRITDSEFGIEFVRATVDGRHTRITVTALGQAVQSGDVVRIRVGDSTGRAELLVVLYDLDEHVTGQIITPAVAMSDELEITINRQETLGDDLADAVTEAVRCSPTAGRNAWRRIAKQLPADHPIRVAVIDGLR
ncbi:hypothetical protein [Nocardia sp. NPDC051832]|uniref:hypothetical protein n=1 Tax=Nocardia sp. NPDC051832 TaxID=3155673 RepID=UPI003434266D